MMHLYLVTDPGQDEDKQDKEDLDDPEYSRQGAEEMAASSNAPGQEPESELVFVRGDKANHERLAWRMRRPRRLSGTR